MGVPDVGGVGEAREAVLIRLDVGPQIVESGRPQQKVAVQEPTLGAQFVVAQLIGLEGGPLRQDGQEVRRVDAAWPEAIGLEPVDQLAA